LDAQNRAAEIKLRAERKAGEMLAGMVKHPGGRPSGNVCPKGTGLSEIGISRKQSSRWQKVAAPVLICSVERR